MLSTVFFIHHKLHFLQLLPSFLFSHRKPFSKTYCTYKKCGKQRFLLLEHLLQSGQSVAKWFSSLSVVSGLGFQTWGSGFPLKQNGALHWFSAHFLKCLCVPVVQPWWNMTFVLTHVELEKCQKGNMSAKYCFVPWLVYINIRTLREECILISLMFNSFFFQFPASFVRLHLSH